MYLHGIWPEAVGTKVAVAGTILRVPRGSYPNKIPWHGGVEDDETPIDRLDRALAGSERT